jgi:hypothetical protein
MAIFAKIRLLLLPRDDKTKRSLINVRLLRFSFSRRFYGDAKHIFQRATNKVKYAKTINPFAKSRIIIFNNKNSPSLTFEFFFQ